MTTDIRKWMTLTENFRDRMGERNIESYDLINLLVDIWIEETVHGVTKQSKQKSERIIAELERRGESWEEMMPDD